MSQPNVLLICCDDLGYGDLGCYGAEFATPQIDELASEGVQFTDWHSNGPICSPTRASIMTGQYPHHVGVPGNAPQGRPETEPDLGLPTEHRTIADDFGEAGYATGHFGKWHLGMTERDDPLAHGFDESFGFLSGCVDFYSHLMMWIQGQGVPPYHDLWENREEVWHNGEYLTHLITDRTVSFIDEQASAGTPFFGYVAYNAPHYPLHAPEEYFDRFPDLDPERRHQAAMIAAIDDGIGEIKDELRNHGLTEETIIVFTSDHGPSREIRNHLDGSQEPYYGGSTGGHRGHKFSLFEGGIRVPGIISHPGTIASGQSCDELACSMDLRPTILEACGLPARQAVDGESLLPVLTEGASTPHEELYWISGDEGAVRRGDWKLVENGSDIEASPDAVHLSNLAEDPSERSNVAEDHPALLEDLQAALASFRASAG